MEIIFCICWMLFGVAFYSFIIGVISAFFTNKETRHSLLHKKITALEEFCKEMNINDAIFEEIKDSTKYSASKIPYAWLDPKNNIVQNLPPQLQYHFYLSQHKNLILENPFFNSFDISFVTRLIPLVTPIKFQRHEIIYDQRQWASGVYFLLEGKVTMLIRKQNNSAKMLEQRLDQSGALRSPLRSPHKNRSTNSPLKRMKSTSSPFQRMTTLNHVVGVFGRKEKKALPNEETLKMILEDFDNVIPFKSMTNGSYFGESDIILRRRRNCTVVASTDCDMFYLSRTVKIKFVSIFWGIRKFQN